MDGEVTTRHISPLLTASWDDELAALVQQFLVEYRELPKNQKEEDISKAQLSSIQSHVGGAGAEGIGRLVKHQLNRNAQNRQTQERDRPGQEHVGKYEPFWKLLHKYLDENLREKTASLGTIEKDMAYLLFVQRLAASHRYQQALEKALKK